MPAFPSEITEAIRTYSRIVIATHVSPDPDAIGSSAALCQALLDNLLPGTRDQILLYLPEECPERLLRFVPKDHIVDRVPEAGYLLIGLDCATKKRLGDSADDLCRGADISINIDHHASNENWGTINYIVPDEAATASLVYDLLMDLSLPVTPHIATSLYAGIMDDTGSFRFSNTNEKVLLTASKLINHGASPSEIATAVYFQEPLHAIKLKGKAIETLALSHDNQVAIAYMSLSMRGNQAHAPGDSEGIIDVVRSVKGIKVAIFLREKDPAHWRASIRSKLGELDVGIFAEKFGGGGHRAAAGFSIEGTEDEVLKKIHDELSVFLS